MREIRNILTCILEKCEIVFSNDEYSNCVFSKEILMQSFSEYLSATLCSSSKNIGIVLHSDPLCFDILTVLFSSLYNIVNSDVSSDELINSLTPGKIVLYQKSKNAVEKLKFVGKYDFDGNVSENYIQLEDEKKNKTWVRDDHWSSIRPYNGNSESLDSRGLRKKNPDVESFFTNVLGYEISEIPVEYINSTVIVMSKERIDQILKNTFIKFSDKTIKLLDLVTATYYTDSNQLFYGGNQTKADPVLKVTNKFDIAFDLIKDNSANSNIGLIVSGDETIKRGYTELERLIKRRSVKNTYILTSIGSDYNEIKNLIADEYEIDSFVCTKEYLKTLNSIEIVEDNVLTRKLFFKTNAIRNQKIDCTVINSIETVDSRLFKMALKKIKESVYESDIKDEFIIQAYSLWNLFQYAIFKITSYNVMIEKGKIAATTTTDRLLRLNEISKQFPDSLMPLCNTVLEQLSEAHKQTEKIFGKGNEIRNALKFSSGKRIALIVHKSIYREVLKDDVRFNGIDIFTISDFIESEMYDIVITFGNYFGNHFNPNSCFVANEVKLLLFDYEIPVFNYRKRRYEEINFQANKDSFFPVCYDDSDHNENELKLVVEEETAEADLISHINSIVIRNTSLFTTGSYSSQSVEAVKVIKFSENECVAYFTRLYKACCFNPNEESVKEIGVDDIKEGNLLLFTKSDSNTRDIIDGIIQTLIASDGVEDEIKHNYELAKVWKETLRNYLIENAISPSKAADDLVKMGATVQAQTIKSWIDIDSQTVKPNDIFNIEIIGKYTGNNELCECTDKYFRACSIIYKLRGTIREEIKKLIVKKFKGDTISDDSILFGIEDLDSLYDLLTVESVFDIRESVPTVFTNRPLNI